MPTLLGFGIPWTALGPGSLFSDSGFVCIYELFKEIHKNHDAKFLINLDPRFKDKFDEYNDPEESGVWGVFNDTDRIRQRAFDTQIDTRHVNGYLSSADICPSDFVLTNKRVTTASVALQADDRFSRYRVPVYLKPTTSGKEGYTKALPTNFKTHTQLEACSYMMASRVFWATAEQYNRGLQICKRYLSPSMVKEIINSHRIIGEGITDLIKPIQLEDDIVARRLQTPQKKFRVSYVGRINSVKNLEFIMDAMVPLFAKRNVKIEIISVGTVELPYAYKRLKDHHDAWNVIEKHETGGRKGREYYVREIVPKVQCGLSATVTECHPSTPREFVYVGIPWLIPSKRAWGPVLFGKDYPFLYDSEESLFALIQRIKKGKITDDEVSRFLKVRQDREKMSFMSYTAELVYQNALKDAQKFIDFTKDHNFSRILTGWEKNVKVGATFIWHDLIKYAKAGGATIGDRPHARTLMDSYTRMRHRMECINPKEGVFKRIE